MGHTAPVNFYPRTTVNRGDTDVPPGYTAGDRLYKQGIKAREQKLKQIQEQKKEQEKKEKKDLTFKPSISKLSKSIILRSGENKNPEVHLLKRGQAMKERLEKKRVLALPPVALVLQWYTQKTATQGEVGEQLSQFVEI